MFPKTIKDNLSSVKTTISMFSIIPSHIKKLKLVFSVHTYLGKQLGFIFQFTVDDLKLVYIFSHHLHLRGGTYLDAAGIKP